MRAISTNFRHSKKGGKREVVLEKEKGAKYSCGGDKISGANEQKGNRESLVDQRGEEL